VQVLPEAPQLAAQGELMPALLQQLKGMQPGAAAAAAQQSSKAQAKEEGGKQQEGQGQGQADGKQ
jgi:hypothetical protein